MSLRTPLLLMALLAATVGAGAARAEHCGKDHINLIGSVASTNPKLQQFVVHTAGKGGRDVLIRTDANTKYFLGSQPATFDTLVAGQKVQVSGTRYVDKSAGAEKVFISTPQSKPQ